MTFLEFWLLAFIFGGVLHFVWPLSGRDDANYSVSMAWRIFATSFVSLVITSGALVVGISLSWLLEAVR